MTATIQRLPRDLPAPTSAANVARRLALVLASQLGYREGRAADGDWNNDNAYGQYFNQNRVSWCNWFISWGAVAANIPATVIPRTGYTPSSWNWYTSRNLDVTSPRAGDLFWVYGYVPSEGQNRVHHIGFVEKVLSEGRIQTLEGNTNTSGSTQGNGVYRNVRTIGPKLRFARPNYAAAISTATPPKPATPTPVKPPVQEDDMSLTEAEWTRLGNLVYDKNYEYGGDLWVRGTGAKFIANTKAQLASLTGQVAGLTSALQALAQNQGVDPAAILAAVTTATEKGVDKALADLKITLAVNDDTDPAPEN
ncbi:MAG TPA: CHAP domain-containing protein [Kribbella sp.]